MQPTREEYAQALYLIAQNNPTFTFEELAKRLGKPVSWVQQLWAEGRRHYGESIVTTSEPVCVCPMQRGGGIDHTPNCAYMAHKQGKIVSQSRVAICIAPGIQTVPVDCLFATGHTRRVTHLATLKKNIQQYGLMQPLHVRSNGEIVDGVQRWQAVKALGHTHIQVMCAG